MKKYLVSIVTVFTLLLVVGCGKKSPLIDKWEGSTEDGLKTTIVFEKVIEYA